MDVRFIWLTSDIYCTSMCAEKPLCSERKQRFYTLLLSVRVSDGFICPLLSVSPTQ